MQGKIIRGIAGFYYVHVADKGVYECKAKGVFRKNNEKPLVGDNVLLDVTDEENKKGNITEILPRNNDLIRPAVANIDQALVIFAAAKPEPNFNLLDRFLLMMQQKGIPCILCFNKKDLIEHGKCEEYYSIYKDTDATILFVSAKEKDGVEQIKELLSHKVTTVAGPSGVGKSSLINLFQDEIQMETGEISSKIDRGKHTTRHSELIAIDEDSFILDTPGFSSLGVFGCDKDTLKHFYPEYDKLSDACRFAGCNHISEPDCAVKEAVEAGELSLVRYENYKQIYEELSKKKKY